MSRLHTSFVLGYHGCESDVARRVLRGKEQLKRSEKSYDWLGPGVYFWESDPLRAWEWAEERVKKKGQGKPAVIGAVIDLGNCLDLMSRESTWALKVAYDSWSALVDAANYTLEERSDEHPKNRGKNGDGDLMLRDLDCQVIKHLHVLTEAEPFDSVRGLFSEGPEAFPGSAIKAKTHVQIAVCNLDCIKGTFQVPKPKDADPY